MGSAYRGGNTVPGEQRSPGIIEERDVHQDVIEVLLRRVEERFAEHCQAGTGSDDQTCLFGCFATRRSKWILAGFDVATG